MSDNKDAMLEYSRFISQKSLWASRCNDPGAYFAQHELRYIGEITERFEERIGSRPEIFRALALALGFALPFLTDSMFVGTQREDFIRRLDKEAGNDLYLQGARYLLIHRSDGAQAVTVPTGWRYVSTDGGCYVCPLPI